MNLDRVRKALLDPPSVFRAPAAVMSDKTLTNEQKIEILRSWEYDARELSVAEEEGMPARNGETLRQILQTLQKLVDELNTDETPPTK